MNSKPMRLGTDITEKEVEHACDKLMQSLGWVAVRFSQPRNTMQSPGIPDRRYYPPAANAEVNGHVPFWLECKRPSGKQSAYQSAFEAMCKVVGEDYVLGGIPELVAYLNDTGIQRMKLHDLSTRE